MVGLIADEKYQKILQAEYKRADLQKEFLKNNPQLQPERRNKLIQLLRKYESLFDGTLGTWKGVKYDIGLKPEPKQYHGHLYTMTHAYKKQVQLKVKQLEQIWVLKKVNHSKWSAPAFVIPKKDQTIRFICKSYPISNIQDLLLKLESFIFATSLDLNMGYYHIE